MPCQVPNRDVRAQQAYGLAQGPRDQSIDVAFAKKWAEVIHDWSARYGDKVAGWWFDGGYQWIGFNDEIAAIYADAVKRGNPQAIVTFNPGVKLIRWTAAEDYTAGELNEPFETVPTERWVDGSQWHALTYLGSSWSKRDTRYPANRWADWVSRVAAKGGTVTLDAGPNWDPQAGPDRRDLRRPNGTAAFGSSCRKHSRGRSLCGHRRQRCLVGPIGNHQCRSN